MVQHSRLSRSVRLSDRWCLCNAYIMLIINAHCFPCSTHRLLAGQFYLLLAMPEGECFVAKSK